MRQVSSKAVKNELVRLHASLERVNQTAPRVEDSSNNDDNDDNNDDTIGNDNNVNVDIDENNENTRKACATYLDLLANTALSFIQAEVRARERVLLMYIVCIEFKTETKIDR
jgi:hypothetical protein